MSRRGGESGQASVELVAAIPALVLVTLLVAQLALAGYALWSAGDAARAGAGRPTSAETPGAPRWPRCRRQLRDDASVHAGDGLAVRVRAPALVPGLPRVAVTARAGLGVGGGGGG